MKKLFSRYFFIFILCSLFGLGALIGVFYYYSFELPPLSELQQYDLKTGSEVYDRHNKLIHTFAIEKRKLTCIAELPPYLVLGLQAVEDKNFSQHWGVDIKGNIRAILINIQRRSFAQGASTITQQLSRNMFLTLDKELPRKLKEILLSIRIERHYSKMEILELYMNKVPFGPGLYGVESASKRFFGKDAKDLNLAEAALIAGMPQLPSAYNPFRYPARAKKRRNQVLDRMLIEKIISADEYIDAYNSEIILYDNQRAKLGAADYFLEHVRQNVEARYGTTMLFTKGLKIYTTIDYDLTVLADSVLNRELSKTAEKRKFEVRYTDFPADTTDIVTDYLQGAALTIEASTGYIRMMLGGRNFNHSKFNRMTQARRQPGSSFKPILYTCALDAGYTPATVIQDQTFSFVQSDTLFYSPHNYANKNFGFTRMREALTRSQNRYAVMMLYDIGAARVVDYARRFGLSTRILPIYTLAIGTCEVKPIELISAYTTFPNGGDRVKPIFIRRIVDKEGNLLEENAPEKIKVISEQTAYLMANMMNSVVKEGTAQGIRWSSYRWNASAKTGTTDDYRDTWFIGYNKELVTGIWAGFDNNASMGKKSTGASVALHPWPDIMRFAVEQDAPKSNDGKPLVSGDRYEYIRPAGLKEVIISKKTGLLPTNSLEETIQEIFIKGTEPTPLSDSLNYNFYPTMYRENARDSLVIDLKGRPVDFAALTLMDTVYISPDDTLTKRIYIPHQADLSGARIYDSRTRETYDWEPPDSLVADSTFFFADSLFVFPDSLGTMPLDTLNINNIINTTPTGTSEE